MKSASRRISLLVMAFGIAVAPLFGQVETALDQAGTWLVADDTSDVETPAAVTVLAVEPLDCTAVIRLGEELLTVTKGDELRLPAANRPAAEGGRFRITDVLADRLVLEETAAEPGAPPRQPRRVWLYKPERPGRPSRVQVLERESPESVAPVRQPKVRQSVPEAPEGIEIKAARSPASENANRKQD